MERHSKYWFLSVGYTVIAGLTAYSSHAQPNGWPIIQRLHKTQAFVNPGQGTEDSPFLALIKDSANVPVYKLDCHNGNYENDGEINFSADFQCALFALKGSALASGNLLAANSRNEQSTDWWNRGRMRSAQLRGECLAYPEYSTDRHFKLRGMLITLLFDSIEWSARKDQQSHPLLGKFTFSFDVIPDKTAISPRAELIVGPAPPRSCYP
jgi:hypothetical protein